MDIVPYQMADAPEVCRLRDLTFGSMNLAAALPWQPCQQIESMMRDGIKLVCRQRQGLLGYGAAYSLDATHVRLNLLVMPLQLRRGIGTRLLDHLETALRPCGEMYLQARVLESMVESVRFAVSDGFREIHRMRGMTLQAQDFAPQPWATLGAKLEAQGFVVTTFHAEVMAH